MPTFRLLHASDLHFYRAEGPVIGLTECLPALARGVEGRPNWVSGHSRDAADALAAFAFVHRDDYDVLLISGDLATSGHPQDLAIAHHFVAAPATVQYHSAEDFPTLAAAGKPILMIPGNHDRFGPARKFFSPGDAQFDAVFGGYWNAGQGAQQVWIGQRGQATLVLIGADLTLEPDDRGDWAGVGHLGRGRAYTARLQALEQLTQQAKANNPGCAVSILNRKPKISCWRSSMRTNWP